MSKRTMILTALAIFGIIAAVFSIYLEKRELEKIDEQLLNEEPEEPEEPEQPTKEWTPKPKKTVKKSEPENNFAVEKSAAEVENETANK